MSDQPVLQKPISATSIWVGWGGLAVFISCLFHFSTFPIPSYIFAVLLIAVPGVVMMAIDLLVMQTYRRKTTNLDWSHLHFDLPRAAVKLCGMALTWGLIAGAYYIFPEYHGTFYNSVWQVAGILLPALFLVAAVYTLLIDSVMKDPKDGYYNFGLIALLQFRRVDRSLILPYIRSWIIKGFFIPLMFVYLNENLTKLPHQLMNDNWNGDFSVFLSLAMMTLFSIDLAFALVGYTFGMRALDSHERSNEPTMLGWLVAIMCYQPFWSVFDSNYLHYEDNVTWQTFFAGHDMIMMIWGSIILLLTAFYSWSTVAFGLRFSNLTHRGIITSGPYRWTKHPAYVSKNISWWMISLPFISTAGIGAAIAHSVMLLMINALYLARAWTEERHLMADPVYCEYQAWMAKNGLFRWVNIPWPKKSAANQG